MGLNIRKEKIIDVGDWDALVQETYKRPYSLQQQDGCMERQYLSLEVPTKDAEDFENDFVPEVINGEEMGVKFKAWLERDPKEWNGEKGDKMFLKIFWGRNFYPKLEIVANDLYKKKLIKKGNYKINIDW